MVLFEVKKVKNISVPRLEVDGKGPRALVSTLVNVAGCVVVDPEHWHQAIGLPIGLQCGCIAVVYYETKVVYPGCPQYTQTHTQYTLLPSLSHTCTPPHTLPHPSNVAATRSNTVHSQSNASSRLGYVGTCLECVIYSLDAVLLHADQETGGELRTTGASVEQGRGGMCEPTLGHQVIGLCVLK